MTKGEHTRQAVVAKALAMATERGLEGLTIGVLAKETGLSKSGLFAHFESKENLQTAVLEAAAERFAEVIAPAFRAPRGEPRIRALFEKALEWGRATFRSGGCVFVKVAHEVGNQPGPVRDVLVRQQNRLLDALKKAAAIAVDEGHFRKDLDVDQFAYDFYSNFLCLHHYRKVLDDPQAELRYRNACEDLIRRSKA
jgi:AcrR family transcriptional regulator